MTLMDSGSPLFTRRLFVASGTIAFLQKGNVAFAQAPEISEVARAAIQDATSVRQFAIETPLEEINGNVGNFVSFEYESRRQTFSALRQTNVASDMQSYLDQLPQLMSSAGADEFDDDALNAVTVIVEALENENLPIIPVADSIEPMTIPSILPEENVADSDIRVVGDIILEGLGVGEPGLLTSIIQSNPEVEEAFSNLVAKISSREWEVVAELLDDILKGSVVRSIIQQIFDKLSRRAKRRFLYALALRAVPFVGWLYTTASFIIAFKSNYHRFSFA